MTNEAAGRLSDEDLVAEYAARILPILPLAQRAYGSRLQTSPAHEASREYTRLLLEFRDRGGNVSLLATALGTTYGAMRRRIITSASPPTNRRPGQRVVESQTDAAVARIVEAKKTGVDSFHRQLAIEYDNGASLSAIAKKMGIKGSAGLYYGMQKARASALIEEIN